MAVEFSPAASRAGEQFLGDPHNPRHTWQVALKSTDLPAAVNPEKGFLVSTNNTPIKTDLPLSLFGNSNDRFLTISAALKKSNPTTVADLMQIQTDVFSRDSLKLAKSLVSLVENSPPAGAEELVAAMAAWDGNYTVDSPGAAAFELTAYHLAFDYYKVRYGEAIARALLRMPVVYAFLEEDVRSGQVLDHLPNALMKAATQFKKSKSWGKLHVMRLSHPLGNAPLIGKKYRFAEQAVPGSTNTVYKSAHPLADGPHTVTYGANARHVSDLSDPDENYFALVGGQDGYWNSANFLDLFQLWRRKQYVRVPMRPETVRENFAHHMALMPAGD